MKTDQITGYHAHVYYDAGSKPAASALRDAIEAGGFEVELGRWHDAPIGPHPCGSYQIAFGPEQFAALVPWLALNRGELDVLVHPDTGHALPDHRDRAMWLGKSYALNLDALR